jgi:hypothetical protein
MQNNESVNQASGSNARPLAKHISNKNEEKCKQCGRHNHATKDCHHLGGSKCEGCGKFGHVTKECWGNKDKKDLPTKRKIDDKRKGKEQVKKKAKTEETSHIEEVETDKEITFSLEECMTFDMTEEGQHFNIQEYGSCNMNGIDECVLYYDWLADSVTTSHIMNQHEAFITYQPLEATTVAGVGNVKAKAEGRGTIKIILYCDSHKYVLTLEDVLYILSNRNNLISLG